MGRGKSASDVLYGPVQPRQGPYRLPLGPLKSEDVIQTNILMTYILKNGLKDLNHWTPEETLEALQYELEKLLGLESWKFEQWVPNDSDQRKSGRRVFFLHQKALGKGSGSEPMELSIPNASFPMMRATKLRDSEKIFIAEKPHSWLQVLNACARHFDLQPVK